MRNFNHGTVFKEKCTWLLGDSGKFHRFTPPTDQFCDTWQIRFDNQVDDTMEITIESEDVDGTLVPVAGFDPRTVEGAENEEWLVTSKNPTLKITVTEDAGVLGTSGPFVVKVKAWNTTNFADSGSYSDNSPVV